MKRPGFYSPVASSPTGAGAYSPLSADADVSVVNDGRVFEELLDAEVVVNMEKLREASRMGIPPTHRGIVYRYLLGVAFVDKSSEMTMEELQDKDFQLLHTAFQRVWGVGDVDDDRGRSGGGGHGGGHGGGASGTSASVLQGLLGFFASSTAASAGATEGSGPLHCSSFASRVTSSGDGSDCSGVDTGVLTMPFVYRGPLAVAAATPLATLAAWEESMTALRHCEPYCKDIGQWSRMEAAMAALRMLYSGISVDHVQLLVLLAQQLDRVSSTARDTFFTTYALFRVLMREGNILHDASTLQTHCGKFLMLFRSVLLPLYEHFTAEGLSTWEWVPSLLTGLFVGRMHPDDVFALWDCYLADVSEHQAMGLHPYTCLAVLSSMTEMLIEASKTELLYCLKHLPRLDTAVLMRKAVLIRESVHSKGLLTGM